MPQDIETIMARIRRLQNELEEQFDAQRETFEYEIRGLRVQFSNEVKKVHRTIKTKISQYIKGARLTVILTAPVIYSVLPALVILDLFVSVYQAICFPVYRIPKVRRQDFIAMDRHHLQYLNGIEKINCAYCSYANGLLAYAVEIASRTEQYWCPIKHARRVDGAHQRYPLFFDYGDGHAYKERLGDMRNAFSNEGQTSD